MDNLNADFLQAYETHLAQIEEEIKVLGLDVRSKLGDAERKSGMMLIAPGNIPFLSSEQDENSVLCNSSNAITVGHAVMIADDTNCIIEAVGNGIGDTNEVIKSLLDDFIRRNDEFYVIWVAADNKLVEAEKGVAAARYAERQLGKSYNWNYLDRQTTEKFYCSQLCWRAWIQQGFKVDYDDYGPFNRPKYWVSPNDIIAGHKNSKPLYKVVKQ